MKQHGKNIISKLMISISKLRLMHNLGMQADEPGFDGRHHPSESKVRGRLKYTLWLGDARGRSMFEHVWSFDKLGNMPHIFKSIWSDPVPGITIYLLHVMSAAHKSCCETHWMMLTNYIAEYWVVSTDHSKLTPTHWDVIVERWQKCVLWHPSSILQVTLSNSRGFIMVYLWWHW